MRCAVVCLLLLVGVGFARDRPLPALVYELSDLVQEHAEGKANFARDRQRAVIAFDAMTYFIHNPDRVGRVGKAHSEHGPNRDGVVLEIEFSDRPYAGPMALPQWLRGPYYFTHCSELKVDDRYLLIRARFGERFPHDLRKRIIEKVGGRGERPSPLRVWVVAKPDQERFAAGRPIQVTATLTHTAGRALRFTTYGTEPADTNAETTNIDLVDLRRDEQPNAILLGRPELKIPMTISGAASHPIESGRKFTVRLDLSKWEIVGGWIPGRYEARVRMNRIAASDKITLSVLSDPVRFVIE